ncbi:unnamed protein product [Trifolium pratense]|uniref:Uncharacterized protein n=1 Tax=Trifolium pratense TaxID=57577 RepID=A0ACB0L7K7_TRIPR|nr:unnamed protein product [Trifolium pratense]
MLQENREVVNIFPAVMQPTDPTVLHPASPFMGGVPTILRPPAPAMGASDSPQILGSPNRPLEANGKEENVCSTIHGEEDEVALETQNLEDENMWEDIHNNAITFSIALGVNKWYCTGLYASPTPTIRANFWHYLCNLKETISGPWFLIGDFNEIIAPSEQRGGIFTQSRADGLISVMDNCDLVDLNSVGGKFTWHRNCRGERSIAKKLDRGMANLQWRLIFPEAYLETLCRSNSDHNPIILRCGGLPIARGTRPFRFEAAWMSHSDYENVVESAWTKEREDSILQEEALKFFKNLFSPATGSSHSHSFDVKYTPKFDSVQASALTQEVTKEEVYQALNQMHPLKSPGPDGFQGVFFRRYWHIMGEDIYTMINQAFSTGHFNPSLDETLICLIPKVDCPNNFKEFRPISLCNTLYKLITKVLVNRLRPMLDSIIGPFQSNFLPGRGTCDNAIILQEIIHSMRKSKSKKGDVAYKIDLEKAYDNVDWSYLRSCLRDFGFPPITIKLIMHCVSSSSLSLIWNGNRLLNFSPTRGLRQGDPLSPYLFVICMEKLSLAIVEAVQDNCWKPIRVSKNGPCFSHLFFADDVLLFSKATCSQGRLMANLFNNFNQMTRNFIWKGSSNKGIHLVGWSSITQTKSDGGLGIRLAREANTAMLGKLVWDIQQNSPKPWVLMLRSKYLQHQPFINAPTQPGSPIWNSISKAKMILADGFKYRVSDGSSLFWYSPWLSHKLLGTEVDYVAIQDSQIRIKDIYFNDSWHLNLLYTPLSSEMKERITSTKFILNNGTIDCFIWQGNIDGIYNASSGYKWLLQQKYNVPSIQSWNWIWKLQAPEKNKFLIWCACHHSIPTMYMLHHRNMTSSSICTRCSNNEETVIHCLRDCTTARRIWEALGYSNISFFSSNNLESWLKIHSYGPAANLFLAGLWWNWRARNIVCVRNEPIHMYQILIEVRKLASLMLSCFSIVPSALKPPRWVTWHPSRDVGFVLNVDGSCLGDSGRAGFGGLIREGDGSWIIGFSGFLGISNNTFAELMAVFHGLKIARERGYRRIHCYSDSQTMVDAISKDLNSFHRYAAVIASIKDLLQLDWEVRLSHSLREGNAGADFLAKIGSANDDKLTFWESPPVEMESILQSDALRVLHPRS